MPIPAIAIVVPTRNRRALLERAVRSVLGQTFGDFELIIVDDGSTDDTQSYLRSLTDPRIRHFLLPDHPGGNAARNKGIDAATAPLVTFLDSDDEYLPDRLRGAVDAFTASPALRLLISSFKAVTRNRRTTCANPPAELDREELEKGLVSHAIYIAGSAITARRDLLSEVGGFDVAVRQMQDRDLLLRIARVSGGRLSPTVDWIKYQSRDSISGRRKGYIKALATLVQRHPVIIERYGNVLRYLIARHVLKDLLGADPAAALESLRTIREFTNLDTRWLRLISGYVAGKRYRSHIRHDIAASGKQPRMAVRRASPPQSADRAKSGLSVGLSGSKAPGIRQ